MNEIVVSGLNPSWQKTMTFQEFRLDAVNRALSLDERASGKGVNFVRAVGIWGRCKAKVFQFSGGSAGRNLDDALKKEGLDFFSQAADGATRICSTLLCRAASRVTELIEPTNPVGCGSQLALQAELAAAAERADALAVCGTAPPDLLPGFHDAIVSRAAQDGKTVLLDSAQQAESVLAAGADVLKINLDELSALTGESSSEAGVRVLMKRHRALRVAAVTDGPRPAFLATRAEKTVFRVPRLAEIRNSIGSGDVCSATFLSELLCGTETREAFRLALAAAAANCLTDEPAHFDRNAAMRLADEISYDTKSWGMFS